MRPLEGNIPLVVVGTKKQKSRAWEVKNAICDKTGNRNKFGSGRYHDLPESNQGVMIAGFFTGRTN